MWLIFLLPSRLILPLTSAPVNQPSNAARPTQGLQRTLISLSQEIPADDHEQTYKAATSALSTDYMNKLQYVPNPINVPLIRR